jgi:uncharacterized membrane protein YkvA (DUF1232 family)
MGTDTIRAQIEVAWQEEARTHAFERLIREQLAAAGAGEVPADSTAVGDILRTWRMQLENVPDLLDALRAAAIEAEVLDTVEPVLATAERYFSDPDDVLPDAYGVLGLLDDMYLALSLIQQISERQRARVGRALIGVDLTESIASVRPLFRGARLAALDRRIRLALEAPELIRCLAHLSELPRAIELTPAGR